MFCLCQGSDDLKNNLAHFCLHLWPDWFSKQWYMHQSGKKLKNMHYVNFDILVPAINICWWNYMFMFKCILAYKTHDGMIPPRPHDHARPGDATFGMCFGWRWVMHPFWVSSNSFWCMNCKLYWTWNVENKGVLNAYDKRIRRWYSASVKWLWRKIIKRLKPSRSTPDAFTINWKNVWTLIMDGGGPVWGRGGIITYSPGM